MRPVIHDGVQYDADKLPRHVRAEDCVPADEWFAQNRRSGDSHPVAASTPATEVPDTGTAPVPNDTPTPGALVTSEAVVEPEPVVEQTETPTGEPVVEEHSTPAEPVVEEPVVDERPASKTSRRRGR